MDDFKYDEWNSLKKKISLDTRDIQFNEKEVWWCSVGFNVGTESFGKGEYFSRPILVIKKLSHETCICVPLSTKVKTGTWFYMMPINNINNYLLLHQIRMFHIKRFQRKIFTIDNQVFLEVKEKLKALLELS